MKEAFLLSGVCMTGSSYEYEAARKKFSKSSVGPGIPARYAS